MTLRKDALLTALKIKAEAKNRLTKIKAPYGAFIFYLRDRL
jgi:hypothetical protein